MSNYKVKSFAKVNLALNVTGKLSKIHKIESIISFLQLHDLIYLKKINSEKHKVSFFGKFSKKIKKQNTIMTLLKILDEKNLLKNKKFQIMIKKNIPQKAGLGGGSMNAAFLLNFFIKKKIIKLKKGYNLANLTKLIGSDVILGLKPNNTVLFSNGKMKTFKGKNKFFTVIVKPRFGCSTKSIYSMVKLYSRSKFNLSNKEMFDPNYLKNLKNDLEKIAFLKHPKLKKIKFFLEKLPNTIFVRMTGSGSAIVAYYNSKKASHYAKKKFKKKFKSDWCITSKTI